MFSFGSFMARDCGRLTRRSFLTMAASAPVALGLPSLTRASESRIKSVVMINLWGGPSQLDTFDPKPNAPSNIRGPFRPIATRTPGVRFSELLPRLSDCQNLFAVVRSTYYRGADHNMMPFTGMASERQPTQEPNFGSIVAKRSPAREMPAFIAINPACTIGTTVGPRTQSGQGAGRLGAAYNPFVVACNEQGESDGEAIRLPQGLTSNRLDDRIGLRQALDAAQRKLDSSAGQAWNALVDNGHRLLAGVRAREAFDLTKERPAVRDAYGFTSFGQSCLLARRLVEADVPYVHVNWSLGADALGEGPSMGWDTHRNGFEQLTLYHGPIADRVLSAFLRDLHQRGLLESTLIVATGEMGRTPVINQIGGRDHWPTCSTLWAGGGVQPGRIVGATNAIGGEPITRQITAKMVGTTIVDRLGIDSQARAEMGVLLGGEVIHELF
jgi:uncharacterized protein (DUF1501 family)